MSTTSRGAATPAGEKRGCAAKSDCKAAKARDSDGAGRGTPGGTVSRSAAPPGRGHRAGEDHGLAPPDRATRGRSIDDLYRVEDKMRLSKDKTTLIGNPLLTLEGIPPQVLEYRLGNRSALDWVIDQYQVTTDKRSGIRSNPNRPDDPEYIVRLVGQVIRVSLETVRIVKALPERYA